MPPKQTSACYEEGHSYLFFLILFFYPLLLPFFRVSYISVHVVHFVKNISRDKISSRSKYRRSQLPESLKSSKLKNFLRWIKDAMYVTPSCSWTSHSIFKDNFKMSLGIWRQDFFASVCKKEKLVLEKGEVRENYILTCMQTGDWNVSQRGARCNKALQV